MKLGTMFEDVLGSLFQRPVTRRYPLERKLAPHRLRGKLRWNAEKCTGCRLCSKDCPANAIDVVMVDKASKRCVVTYHLDRCTFCAQCVYSCAQNALELSNDEWDMDSAHKDEFTIYYGGEADVGRALDKVTEADTEVAEAKK